MTTDIIDSHNARRGFWLEILEVELPKVFTKSKTH